MKSNFFRFSFTARCCYNVHLSVWKLRRLDFYITLKYLGNGLMGSSASVNVWKGRQKQRSKKATLNNWMENLNKAEKREEALTDEYRYVNSPVWCSNLIRRRQHTISKDWDKEVTKKSYAKMCKCLSHYIDEAFVYQRVYHYTINRIDHGRTQRVQEGKKSEPHKRLDAVCFRSEKIDWLSVAGKSEWIHELIPNVDKWMSRTPDQLNFLGV